MEINQVQTQRESFLWLGASHLASGHLYIMFKSKYLYYNLY